MNPITTLKELKDIEIDVLKRFIKFCNDNDLKYFVVYGTLLGTIRHNGMIPWDDDIDVCMPRQDYQKFIELTSKKSIDSFIKTDNPLNNNESSSLIVRAYDDRTIITGSDFKIGVFVDIHPLDEFPENNIIRKLWFLWIEIHKKGMILSKVKIKSASTFKFFLKMVFSPVIITTKIIGFKYFKNMVVNSAQYYSSNDTGSQYFGVILADWPLGKLVLKKSYFNSGVLKNFEGIKVRVPVGYENLLRLWYGDYMALPKEEDRKPKHEFVAFWC
ncbi:MAG: LicD family protein [Acidaminococcaceae bacterium]|nr:LicD family protein [Acidaminococcaceae bacterium]